MSIIYCDKHHAKWDSDKLDACPWCENDSSAALSENMKFLDSRPLLHTDTIRGKQIERDDMWVITTQEIALITACLGRFEMVKNQILNCESDYQECYSIIKFLQRELNKPL